MTVAATPTVELVPNLVAGSLDELLSTATSRSPFLTSDSKSGSRFERVVIAGESHIVKYVHVDDDWTMRASGDITCRPLLAYAAGLTHALPERIDATVVGAVGGLGRNGWGAALLMRDVSSALIPAGDDPLEDWQHAQLLDDCAAFAARLWGWRDNIGLLPYVDRWRWFADPMLAVECARPEPERVPVIAADGWRRFAERAPRDVTDLINELRRDPTPLGSALANTPQTFVHGDWKLGNLGVVPDGPTLLIDWAYPGAGPVCHELAWYLALNRSRLPRGISKEDSIATFRVALERHGVLTAPWWETQSALCLLGALVQFGWEKALGDDTELGWWCDRAREGVRFL